MNKNRIRHLKELLLRKKSEAEAGLKSMEELGAKMNQQESTGELSSYDNHPADSGTEAFEREKDLGLRVSAEKRIELMEKALKKIEEGTYGICERCGREISLERLEAIPYTQDCIECREEMERVAERNPRPIEEEALKEPFVRTFDDGDDSVVTDGEDIWQDVAAYGTASSLQDEPHDPGSVAYSDSGERLGAVEDVELIAADDPEDIPENPKLRGRRSY